MTTAWFFGLSGMRLVCSDPDASQAFYAAITGEDEPIRVTGTAGWSNASTDSPDVHGWVVEFGVSDVEAMVGRCLDRGAHIEGEIGRTTFLLDPRGARFGLRRTSPGAAIDHTPAIAVPATDLYTRTTEASTEFYRQAFDLEPRILPDDPVDYVQLLRDGRHVLGILDVTTFLGESTPDQWMPYLHFADVDRAIERATALGALVAAPASDSPTGRYGIIRDPSGHLIGMWDGVSVFESSVPRTLKEPGESSKDA